MEGMAAWLSQITWPLVSRVLTALGFGYVTYEGASGAVEAALNAAKASIGGIGMDVAALLAKAGFFDYMAITSGGIVSGLAWLVMKRMALHSTGSAT